MNTTESSHIEGLVKITLSAATPAASIALGLIVVRMLVAPIVPGLDTRALMMRFFAYAFPLAVLFHCCDIGEAPAPFRFAPFSGLAAAVCSAAPYLQILGVPGSWILAVIVWFQIGYAPPSFISSTPEERIGNLSLQLVRFSQSLLVATAIMLFSMMAVNTIPAKSLSAGVF